MKNYRSTLCLKKREENGITSYMRPVEENLTRKLTQYFQPIHIHLENESPMHGLKPEAEKHFRAVIVSEKFAGLQRVARHRLVHDLLGEELKTHVHALSVQAYTPEEWSLRLQENGPDAATHKSPPCLGGSKHERNRS
jgi:stress-induced morphogen